LGKTALSSPSSRPKQGRGNRCGGGAWPAALGRGSAREEGKEGPGGARGRSPFPILEEGPCIGGSGGRGRGGQAAAAGSAGGAARSESLRGKREREERGLLSPAHLGRMRLEEVARLGPVGGRRWRAWRRRRWKSKEAAGGGAAACGSAGVLLGPLYRRSRSVERAVVAGWPARLVMRLLGGVNGVGAGSVLGVNGGRGSSSEATRRLRQAATAAGGAVPRSPPLCSVNGGRPVSWRARAGVEHGARASGAGRRGATRRSRARPGGAGARASRRAGRWPRRGARQVAAARHGLTRRACGRTARGVTAWRTRAARVGVRDERAFGGVRE